MMRTDLDPEFVFSHYKDGIKFQRPDKNTKALSSLSNLLEMPMNVYLMNTESTNILLNEENARNCGFNSVKDGVNKGAIDITEKHFAIAILRNDHQILFSERRKIIEETVLREDKILPGLTIKMPWYNEENKIQGIFGVTAVYDKQPLAESLTILSSHKLLNAFSSRQNISVKDVSLTPREYEVIKFTVLGKSAKVIGQILKISSRTVEKHLNNIKIKMNVTNKYQLIDKVIDEFIYLS